MQHAPTPPDPGPEPSPPAAMSSLLATLLLFPQATSQLTHHMTV
jgi:hypothetical protein